MDLCFLDILNLKRCEASFGNIDTAEETLSGKGTFHASKRRHLYRNLLIYLMIDSKYSAVTKRAMHVPEDFLTRKNSDIETAKYLNKTLLQKLAQPFLQKS